ncbi:hypothetical protein AB840_07685 [Megasphaera cerevisiae DSM 20462]|uniref:Uncharacterized protein n=1 Tax=Megasphaera cerevisiae DSM 20462 TaxID=1122219 RepID=A0A0J6ZNS7_9FIRM|nr:hypothetical protein AB840_07685 [Megasphaera cerevisiae DSM 20462]OKY54878.1 hypothetical protein BSR42_00230 [Megasphaera cerevisiae]
MCEETDMKKLTYFLWAVVFIYLIYAMVMEGLSAAVIGLFLLAVLVLIMQIWMKSDIRRKLRNRYRDS